jgi:cytochrome b
MPPILENEERRKHRDPEMLVWDRVVRIGHWLLALAFATLYLEYRKFPLHPYAGYLVLIVVLVRIGWGFVGTGAARFSSFRFSPRQMWRYLRSAMSGHAEYHFSHNPMGAAMVYALLGMLLLDSVLGLLTYSANQQLGPFGALVPDAWEDRLIAVHSLLGHITAGLVVCHLAGVVWAARLHRENYALAMLNGIRRIPRAVQIPEGMLRPVRRGDADSRSERLRAWLTYRRPVFGTLLLMAIIIGLVALPLIGLLVRLNKLLPAY